MQVDLAKLQAENLKLGEYTIVVTNVEVDDSTPAVSSATIEVYDPDGFSLGKKAAEIGTAASAGIITIGTETGKQIKIDTKINHSSWNS